MRRCKFCLEVMVPDEVTQLMWRHENTDVWYADCSDLYTNSEGVDPADPEVECWKREDLEGTYEAKE